MSKRLVVPIDAATRHLRRRSGSEVVYDTLRSRIISGELAADEKLPELELASDLGVSRTPVREALRLLLGERLVETRTSGGFQVAPLQTADIRAIYDVRALLEGLLARDACGRLSNEDLKTLRERIEQMVLLRDHDGEVVRVGREFHALIEAGADNRWCVQLLQQLRGHIDRCRNLSTREPGRSAAAIAEHQAIYDALASADPEAAEKAMRDHVRCSGESALRSLAGG